MPTPRSFAEHVCLALVVEGFEHGWAIGSELAPDGDLGHIWSLSRPLTYRALDQLADEGLIERGATMPGRGGDRRLLRASANGRRTTTRWLGRPVDHLRDVRTEFLVKVELRRRRGLPVADLAAAQRAHVADTIDALVAAGRDAEADPVALWRAGQAAAVARFLDELASR